MAVALLECISKNYGLGGKPILCFVKGNRTNTVNDISDIIKSQPVEKALDEWEQSTVEADHCILYLTVENQTILDPMMEAVLLGCRL